MGGLHSGLETRQQTPQPESNSPEVERTHGGLMNRVSQEPVPLKNISVSVEIKGFVADIVSTLVYMNEEENPLEAMFVFPMHNDSAVYKFEATLDGKTIVAEIQDKQQAWDTYDDAISSGMSAFLLERDEISSDVFACFIGNLPPKQEATVGLAFVMELPLEADGAVRFVLPGVLNPRYAPQGSEQGHITHQVPSVPVDEVPYNLELNASIQYPHGITKVESNSAITLLEYLDSGKTSAQVSLNKEHQFNKDIELLIYYSDVHNPSICLESGLETAEAGSLMGDAVLMLNFYPNFPENASRSDMQEFIFVVDRSQSMSLSMNNTFNAPDRMSSTKETLLFLLKSLPLGCYFNIYGFGSYYESLFPESREYTQESMQEAVQKVKNMAADFHGTEILAPLQDIYSKACVPGYPRQLFVFTDGEVWNTRKVISLVKQNASVHRCFSFGIGEGASTALVQGIAKAASGTAEFITGKERMQPKVMRSLKCALQSSVKDLAVNWQLPSGVEASLLSKAPVVIFRDQRSIIYAQLKGKLEEKAEGHASIEYTFGDQKVKEILHFSLEPDRNSRLTIHYLAAKRMIAELEEGEHENLEEVKKRITALSLHTGIISSHTAFVAVNKELNQPIIAPLIMKDVYTSDYHLCDTTVTDGVGTLMLEALCTLQQRLCASSHQFLIKRLPFYRSSHDIPVGQQDEEMKEEAGQSSPIVKLISLQNADGSWKLDTEFASVMKLSEQELSNKIPKKEIDSSVWATVLAIVWLHEFGAEQKDEWEILVEKALSWVKAHAGSDLKDCSIAAAKLLKAPSKSAIFGLNWLNAKKLSSRLKFLDA